MNSLRYMHKIFSPNIEYDIRVPDDLNSIFIKAQDDIEINGLPFRVFYTVYPKKNIEEMNISENKRPYHFISFERMNKKTYEITGFQEIPEWEEANPGKAKDKKRFDIADKIFYIFYSKLAEKQEIEKYLRGIDEKLEHCKKEWEKIKKQETIAKKGIKKEVEKRKKELRAMPDPLETFYKSLTDQ